MTAQFDEANRRERGRAAGEVVVIGALLKRPPAGFDEPQRQAIVKIVSDRAIHNAVFAMLGRQEGQRKIVCMSFPKWPEVDPRTGRRTETVHNTKEET
jgi:hypothetical protein